MLQNVIKSLIWPIDTAEIQYFYANCFSIELYFNLFTYIFLILFWCVSSIAKNKVVFIIIIKKIKGISRSSSSIYIYIYIYVSSFNSYNFNPVYKLQYRILLMEIHLFFNFA